MNQFNPRNNLDSRLIVPASSSFEQRGIPVANLFFDYDQSFELFDFNTIYCGPRAFQLSITRMDAPSGWHKPLLVTLNGIKQINVGASDSNKKTVHIQTGFDLVPKRQQYNQKIPKLIFQTCDDERLKDPLMQNSIHSIVMKNPEYEHIHYSDKQCATFLADTFPPCVSRAWNILQVGAYKADLWRYCMLYKHGGIYIDCKMIEHVSLCDFISPFAEIVLVKDIIGSWLYQAFLACVPGHWLMEAAIETTVQNVLTRNYGTNPTSISGPAMLGLIYNQQRKMKPGIIIAESENVFANVTPSDALGRRAIKSNCRALYEKPEWMWTFVVKGSRTLFSKCFPGYYANSGSKHYSQHWSDRSVFYND